MYNFNQVIGHDDIISHMKTAYQLGKKLLTNCFVKLLQCENPEGNEPCNRCSSCVQIDSGNHPDVIYVKPTKKSGYGVSDIRDQVVKDINIKPYRSKYKIYIINEADSMTVQAQNSMLKTIEEPPEYGMFFLLAENSQRFLQTILSRTVKMTLKPVHLQLIEAYLRNKYSLDESQVKTISSFSRGNIGKAIQLQDSEVFTTQRNDMVKLLDIFINHQEYDIMNAVRLLEEYKDQISEVLEILVSMIRDILYYKETKISSQFIHQDLEMKIIELSQKAKSEKLIQLVKNSYAFTSQMRLNVNFSLAVLSMLTNV